MRKIRKTSKIVKKILEICPDTRNSDELLYVNVCKVINPMACSQPFETVMLRRRELSLPPIESVGRCRRKLQESYPELCGSDDVTAMRELNEQVVKDYARSVSV